MISTHILGEAHAVCNRAIIIAGGKLLADATPAELEARSRYHGAVSLTTEDAVSVQTALSAVPGIESIEIDPEDSRLTAFPRQGRSILAAVSEVLKAQGVTVRELQLETGRLDEVFRAITRPYTREARA